MRISECGMNNEGQGKNKFRVLYIYRAADILFTLISNAAQGMEI